MKKWDRMVSAVLIGVILAPPGWARASAVEEVVRQAEELAKKFPAERYNLDAFAKTLAPGVEPAFALVRDRIRFEAYPGVFRGAGTTFYSEAGNSYDRSLLLADLLKRQGIQTRFALGRLSPERASMLFDRMFSPRPR